MNIGNKLLAIFLLTIVMLKAYAGNYEDIDWGIDYNDAISIAKQEDKPTMVLITSKRCKWCKKLKHDTLGNEAIIDRLNDKFSTVEVTRKESDYPYKKLRARAVPTIYFLDKNGEPIIRPVVGYWNVENFNSYLDDVERKVNDLK